MEYFPLIVATCANLAALAAFIYHGRKFTMAQADAIKSLNDATTQLNSATAQLGKIAAEEKGLQDQVAALQAAAGNSTGISTELQAAIDGTVAAAASLSAAVQSTDDQVADSTGTDTPPSGIVADSGAPTP